MIPLFVSGVSEVQMQGGKSYSEMGDNPALVPPARVRAPGNQKPVSGVGDSKPYQAESTWVNTVFVPVLSELQIYGGISEPGVEP